MKESRSKGTTVGHGRTTPGCGAQAGSEGCILDESRSLGSLQKPLLIGGHTWGSEHLKLFHTQQKFGSRPSWHLAPANSQRTAAPVPVGSLPTQVSPRSFENPVAPREIPPGLLVLGLMLTDLELMLMLAVSAHHHHTHTHSLTHLPCLYLAHMLSPLVPPLPPCHRNTSRRT